MRIGDVPITNISGILAPKFYEEGLKATMQQELISHIQSQLKNFDSNFLQSLMGGVKTKFRSDNHEIFVLPFMFFWN
jgi:hypothetical protein